MDTLHFIPATLEDAPVLLSWRNDEATRHASVHTKVIQMEEHKEWLARTLSGAVPGRTLRIALLDGHKLGVIRSDLDPTDGYHELSYTVAPEWRGKGMGKMMVTQYVAQHLANAPCKATILDEGNLASEAVAKAVGMRPDTHVLLGTPPRRFCIWKN